MYNNVDGLQEHYAMWNKSDRKLIYTENVLVVARGRGWRVEKMGKEGEKVKTNFESIFNNLPKTF